MYFAAIWTDGEMTTQQVMNETRKENFVPLFALYDEEDNPTIVLFPQAMTVVKFLKRNTPRGCPIAAFQICEEDLDKMKELGWNTVLWDFPKKVEKLKHGFEIFEFVETPELRRI